MTHMIRHRCLYGITFGLALVYGCTKDAGQLVTHTSPTKEDAFPMPSAPGRLDLPGYTPPSSSDLAICTTNVAALAAHITTEEDLLAAQHTFLEQVLANPPLHHGCLMHMLQSLERTLDHDGGVVFSERGRKFFLEMTKLWLLARTLDGVRHTDQYVLLVKKCYIAWSKTVFGRDLTSTGEPLGLGRTSDGRTVKSH